MGDVEISHTVTIQDAIAANGLAGSVITIRPNKLAVVVEGASRNIRALHQRLAEGDVMGLTPTALELRQDEPEDETRITKKDVDTVVAYLKEIDRNLRRINHRLAALEDGRPQRSYTTHSALEYYQTADESQAHEEKKDYAWSEKEKTDDEEEGGSVFSDFFNQ